MKGLKEVFGFTLRQQLKIPAVRTLTVVMAVLFFLVPAAAMTLTELSRQGDAGTDSWTDVDYDPDGTLAIWIGGQKIGHEYYSISNDHQTLWIYRNLLDQLKSNNSYTLTARLWAWKDQADGTKVKQTWYPATASFNILAAGSTSYRSPKTGDESNVALWAAVLVLSGGAVVALVPRKKKSK